MSTGTDAASAVSRIALATRSAPLATSSGAGFVPSYFSATAKWVGFVTTTSAVATSAIMRFRACANCRRRMAPLISGARSLWRVSCLTSSLVIFIDFSWRRFCQA